MTGISSVQLLLILGNTSTGLHLVTYATAPLLAITWPLPKICSRLYGLSAPAMASNQTNAVSLRLWHISYRTWRIFSCRLIDARICRKLMVDSNRVVSRSSSKCFPLATSILGS